MSEVLPKFVIATRQKMRYPVIQVHFQSIYMTWSVMQKSCPRVWHATVYSRSNCSWQDKTFSIRLSFFRLNKPPFYRYGHKYIKARQNTPFCNFSRFLGRKTCTAQYVSLGTFLHGGRLNYQGLIQLTVAREKLFQPKHHKSSMNN